MIKVTLNGNTKAKFENWDGNKAMDWITQKGWFIKNKVYLDSDIIWVVSPLP